MTQRPRVLWVDPLLVGLISALPGLRSLDRLGLYSDDWAFLATVQGRSDQGPLSSLLALAPQLIDRPPDLVMLAVLYGTFGARPLGSHLVEVAMLASGVALLVILLRRSGVHRGLAAGVSLVYGTTPLYSTDRIWVAAVHASLALVLCVVACHCTLQAVRASRWRGVWTVLATVALATAGLSYEVFLPIGLLPMGYALTVSRDQVRDSEARRTAASLGLAMLAVIAYKLLVSTRIPTFPSLEARVRWMVFVVREATQLSLGLYGLGLPLTALRAASRWPDSTSLVFSVIAGTLSAAYIFCIGTPVRRGWSRALLLGGLVVFLLGLAIFGTNYAFVATPSGNGNRIMIAAGLGVAPILLGLPMWIIGRWCSAGASRVVFAALVGGCVGCGVLINSTIASLWVAAGQQQDAVISNLQAAAPTLPRSVTLLLDGVCPYVGPGIVFEAPWDVTGRLQVAYGDASLRGDIVSPRLRIGPEGVTTETYGVQTTYSYANLLVFDASRRVVAKIDTLESAQQFFAAADPTFGAQCGEGRPGSGLPIF